MQIKFRGKDIEAGEWRYGYYFCVLGQHKIINSSGQEYFVEEETVGQYIGLEDKYKVEIYSGDIIKKQMEDKPYSSKQKSCTVIMKVVWRDGRSNYSNEHNDRILKEDPSSFNDNPKFDGIEIRNERGYGCFSWSVFAGCEVIGSVTDNPELLTQ